VTFGDTPHTPVQASNWPDATPSASNWMYVMGQGYIDDGWFGRVEAPPANASNPNNAAPVYGFDPVTGDDVLDKPSAETSAAAGAAVSYAITRGDWNTVTEYYSGPKIDGMLKV
jgi:hypothetical protein